MCGCVVIANSPEKNVSPLIDERKGKERENTY